MKKGVGHVTLLIFKPCFIRLSEVLLVNPRSVSERLKSFLFVQI